MRPEDDTSKASQNDKDNSSSQDVTLEEGTRAPRLALADLRIT